MTEIQFLNFLTICYKTELVQVKLFLSDSILNFNKTYVFSMQHLFTLLYLHACLSKIQRLVIVPFFFLSYCSRACIIALGTAKLKFYVICLSWYIITKHHPMRNLRKDLKSLPYFKGISKLLHQKYAKLRRKLSRLLQEQKWEKGRQLLLVQQTSFKFNELNLRSDQLSIHTFPYLKPRRITIVC